MFSRFLTVLILIAASLHIWAADKTWDNQSTDGLWLTPSNWSASAGDDNTVPTVSDDVFLPGALSGGITMDAGLSASSLTFSNNYTLGSVGDLTLATGMVAVDASFNAVINTKLSGSAGLVKAGPGQLTLRNATNNFTGGLNIQAGTLSFTDVLHLNSANNGITLGSASSAATLSYSGNSATLGSAMVLGSNGSNIIESTTSGQTLTLSGLISAGPAGGATAIIIKGAGIVKIDNPGNSFLGDLVIDGGKLEVSGENGGGGDPLRLGPNTQTKTITLKNGGTFISSGTTVNPTKGDTATNKSKNFIIGIGGGTFQTDASLTLDDAGQFGGTPDGGQLTKTGNQTLVLNGDFSSYTGTQTHVNGGTLAIRTDKSLGTVIGSSKSLINLATGTTLSLRNNNSTNFDYPVNLLGNATLNVDRHDQNSGNAHRLGKVTMGSSTLTFTSGNSFSLNINGGIALSGNPTIAQNSNGPSLTISSFDAGTGSPARTITKTGSGIMIVSGAGSNFSGTTTVNSAGETFMSVNNVFGDNALLTASGTMDGFVQTAAPLAGYRYVVGTDGMIGGNKAFLSALAASVGPNSTDKLNQIPRYVFETEAGGNAMLVTSGSAADRVFGVAGTINNETVSVGTGTPWFEISNDRTGRNLRTGTITVEGPFSIRSNGGNFDLGANNVSAASANLNFVQGSSGIAYQVTHLGGTVRLYMGPNTHNGGVGSSNLSGISKFVVPTGVTFQAGTTSTYNVQGGLGGTWRPVIELQSGGILNVNVGTLDDNGATAGGSPAGALNGPVRVLPGAVLLLDDAENLTSTGVITQWAGSVNDISNATALANQSTGAVAGAVVRMRTDNIEGLNNAPDNPTIAGYGQAANFVAWQTTTTGAGTRTQTLTLNSAQVPGGFVSGFLTAGDEGHDRIFAGALNVGSNGAGIAAINNSRTLSVSAPIAPTATAGDRTLTIGSNYYIDPTATAKSRNGVVVLTGSNTWDNGSGARIDNINIDGRATLRGAPASLPQGTFMNVDMGGVFEITGPSTVGANVTVDLREIKPNGGQLYLNKNSTAGTPNLTVRLNAPIARDTTFGLDGRGTLTLATANGTLGGTANKVLFANAVDAPSRLVVNSTTINMVAPWIIGTQGNASTFLDVDPGSATTTGFVPVTYDGALPTVGGSATVIYDVTASTTLSDTVDAAAVRITQPVGGSGKTLNIHAGGVLFSNNPTNGVTVSANLNFIGEAIVTNIGGQANTISGKITAPNGFTKAGNNSLTLSNSANAISNGITIAEGNLRAGNSTAFANNVLTINTAGVLDMNAQNPGIAGLQGAGIINNQASSSTTANTLTITTAATTSYSFSGLIADNKFDNSSGRPVAITKAGTGTQILSGMLGYTGATTVSAGTLQVDGYSVRASAYSVAAGAILSGKGSITGSITVSGDIVPATDGTVGILTTGNLTLNSGANARFDINGATDTSKWLQAGYDQLTVNGTVAINNAELRVSLNHVPLDGEMFFLVHNDNSDAVTGTFNNLAQDALTTINGTQFRITYSADDTTMSAIGGNDVALIAQVPEPGVLTLLTLAGVGFLGRRRRK